MDRKLLDYLPPVLREVMEFTAINEANEPEIALAWDVLSRVLANQFLETADVWGVSVWEKELKIFPKDTDSLELRKARIKAKWNQNTPYTVTWLRNWLTGIFGVNVNEVKVEDYTLMIRLNQDLSEEMNCKTIDIFEMLLSVIPENILFMLENIFPELPACIPIRVIPAPRISSSAAPPHRAKLPQGKFCVTPTLGVQYSTVMLPMAVEQEGG